MPRQLTIREISSEQGARAFFKQLGAALLAKQKQQEDGNNEKAAAKCRSDESDTVSVPIDSSSYVGVGEKMNPTAISRIDASSRKLDRTDDHSRKPSTEKPGKRKNTYKKRKKRSSKSRIGSTSAIYTWNDGERNEYELGSGSTLIVVRKKDPKSVTYHLRNSNGRSVFLEKTSNEGMLMCTEEKGSNRRFIAYRLQNELMI
ncbi:hypothetical protein Tcan_03636 [Toxocara canis]|uniref:Uncharacterized protein n=1 Tax=Toxocara canis TaxID=6265 RepID=A0A0B2VBV2_TOXCA|nr:hypothetical protein Tcan_03636 [Toxocara canis]